MNITEAMYERIRLHGECLNKIFCTQFNPIDLCKKLFRLENKAHRLSEDYCNGLFDEEKTFEKAIDAIEKKVNKILDPSKADVKIIINTDPRGYALNIKWDHNDVRKNQIPADLGGYGLIAPNLRLW